MKFLINSIKLGMTVTLLFLLLEGVLWTLAPLPKDPDTHLTLRNEIEGFQELVDYHTDANGTRYLDWNPKSPGPRILCIGGKSTEAVLQNPGDSWWGQMKQQAETVLPDTHLQIAAQGRVRNLIAGGAQWTRQFVDELQPDVILVQFGFFDVVAAGSDYTYDPDRIDTIDVLPSEQRSGAKRFLMNTSQTFRRISHWRKQESRHALQAQVGAKNFFTKADAEDREMTARLPSISEVPREDDPLREYLDGAKAFIELCEERDISLIVVGEGSMHHSFLPFHHALKLRYPIWVKGKPYRPDPMWVEKELNRYYEATAALCEEANVPFISMNEEKRIPKNPQIYYDDSMLTDEGSKLVGRKVAPLLVDALKKQLNRR